jgi:putative DNA primase/helicase
VTGSLAFVAAARAAYIVAKDQGDPQRRLMLPIKNNLGEDQSGYAFRVEGIQLAGGIQTSRVAWEGGSVTVTANEVLAPAQVAEDRSAVEEAADFLVELLGDGPVSSRQVEADAKGAGHSWAAIRRARQVLGVEVVKSGMRGGWEWRLPTKALKTAEGAQERDVSTFANVEHLRQSVQPDAEVL